MGDNFTIEEVFESAVSIVRNLPKEGSVKPSDELKLKLYAYYKQATHGPNDTPKPRFYKIVEVYKWDAWRKLGDMSKETAMQRYIDELRKIMESIPEEAVDPGDDEHFKEVLGKKFYDYWFEQWKTTASKRQQMVGSENIEHRTLSRNRDIAASNDSICDSHSSQDSSNASGYKTPITCLDKEETLGTELSKELIASLLRLQVALQRKSYIWRQNCSPFKRVSTINNMSGPAAFNVNCMTLTRFLIEEQRRFPSATGELTTLLNALQTAIKTVSSAVRKAGMINLFGLTETVNVQGEEVKRLDVLSNELFINMLKSSYTTCLMISEENEKAIEIEKDKAGKYVIAFDPLDGSSNIEASVSIGSIFAVYKKPMYEEVLVHGRNIVTAGYALYGSATVIVLAINDSVHSFMLDPAIGEFILTEANLQIKPRGNIYSVNEGYHSKWDEPMRRYIHRKKYPTSDGAKPYSSRYVGSMVADLHRTFKYGGIFMYPATKDAPNGKLRLLYECNPMAYIAEAAGGLAMAAPNQAILDIFPTKIHQRTPIFIGSREDVLEIMAEYDSQE